MKKIIFAFIFAFAVLAPPRIYAFDLPTGLKVSDLSDMVEILGYPTNTKFLSNPFPLGGHSGFEVGFTSEFIDTTDLSRLGTSASQQSSIQYNSFSLGKGLYYNIDVFVNFIPFANSSEISDYGGILKWNFYQAEYLPISISIIGHINTVNIQDLFLNEAKGWDILAGFNLKTVALYAGAGQQYARSTFSQNILDTSDSQIQQAMSSQGTIVTHNSRIHSFIGLQVSVSSIFFAAQIDRNDQPAYSAKLGMRF